MKGREQNAKPEQLDEKAEILVKDAIQRGRKRRPQTRNVSDSDIKLRSTPNIDPTTLANSSKQNGKLSYHKRRKTSLIPQQDDSEGESNDEWEEHIEVDHETMKAAVDSATPKQSNDELKTSKTIPEEEEKQSVEEPELTEEQKLKLEEDKKSQERKDAIRIRKKAWRKHSIHIVLSLASLLRMDDAANNDSVQAIALSIIPQDTFLQTKKFSESLARFGLWFRLEFQMESLIFSLKANKNYLKIKRPCSVAERVTSIAQNSMGEMLDIATFAAAIVRAQGYRCRIVQPMQFITFQPPKFSKSQNKASGRAQVVITDKDDNVDCIQYAWLEVWSPEAKKWLPVDLYTGTKCDSFPTETLTDSIEQVISYDPSRKQEIIDPKKEDRRRRSVRRKSQKIKEPKSVKQRNIGNEMYAHVIAVENGYLTDVTRRYVLNWSDVEKVRAKGKALEKALENLGRHQTKNVNDEAIKSEMAEFDALAADEEIPTTITGVQKHPRYIMERHIKRYEIIFPKEPIMGYIKEEPIYLSSHVRLLHTKDRWIRVMREVLEGAKPLKSVKSKNGTDAKVNLFGEWQTRPLIIPAVENGKVPRGPHGNVDLWTNEHLPEGGVHVNVPYAKVAARKLGIDFAPAMTGFDVRGGRSIPKIEGVVVAIENEQVVRDAAKETERAAFERREKRLREEACQRWLKLFRAVKARQKVKQKYGGLLEGETTNEAQHKTSGKRRSRGEKLEDGARGSTNENDGNLSRNGKRVLLTETHQHDFDEAKCVEGSHWVKTCKICKIDVSFEQL